MSLKPGYFNTIAISAEELLNDFLDDKLAFAANSSEAAQLLLITKGQTDRDNLQENLNKKFHEYEDTGFEGKTVTYETLRVSEVVSATHIKNMLPENAVGIALYTYGMEPDDDWELGDGKHKTFLEPLTADRAAHYPGWLVVGVIAQDDPDAGRYIQMVKRPMMVTVTDVMDAPRLEMPK